MSTAPNPNYALAGFKAEGTFAYDALLSDGLEIVSKVGTLTSGIGVVKRGTIVNIDPTSGAVILAVLGTSAPNAIVAENADSTSAAVGVLVYVSGAFKADQIIWPAAGSHAAITDALRDNHILIESVEGPGGGMIKSAPTSEEQEQEDSRSTDNPRIVGDDERGPDGGRILSAEDLRQRAEEEEQLKRRPDEEEPHYQDRLRRHREQLKAKRPEHRDQKHDSRK
jgi:hypothetical protein